MFRTPWTVCVLLCLGIFSTLPAQASRMAEISRCLKSPGLLTSGITQGALRATERRLATFVRHARHLDGILIVDYSLNVSEDRQFLLDLNRCRVLKKVRVAAGGSYRKSPGSNEWIHDGDPNMDGRLDKCKNRRGTRQYMTRPGFYVTRGCHQTGQHNWEKWPVLWGRACRGVKLHGLESQNSEAMRAGIVLHEHRVLSRNRALWSGGQGCPTTAPGELKSTIRSADRAGFDLREGTLVHLYAPQC